MSHGRVRGLGAQKETFKILLTLEFNSRRAHRLKSSSDFLSPIAGGGYNRQRNIWRAICSILSCSAISYRHRRRPTDKSGTLRCECRPERGLIETTSERTEKTSLNRSIAAMIALRRGDEYPSVIHSTTSTHEGNLSVYGKIGPPANNRRYRLQHCHLSDRSPVVSP